MPYHTSSAPGGQPPAHSARFFDNVDVVFCVSTGWPSITGSWTWNLTRIKTEKEPQPWDILRAPGNGSSCNLSQPQLSRQQQPANLRSYQRASNVKSFYMKHQNSITWASTQNLSDPIPFPAFRSTYSLPSFYVFFFFLLLHWLRRLHESSIFSPESASYTTRLLQSSPLFDRQVFIDCPIHSSQSVHVFVWSAA